MVQQILGLIFFKRRQNTSHPFIKKKTIIHFIYAKPDINRYKLGHERQPNHNPRDKTTTPKTWDTRRRRTYIRPQQNTPTTHYQKKSRQHQSVPIDWRQHEKTYWQWTRAHPRAIHQATVDALTVALLFLLLHLFGFSFTVTGLGLAPAFPSSYPCWPFETPNCLVASKVNNSQSGEKVANLFGNETPGHTCQHSGHSNHMNYRNHVLNGLGQERDCTIHNPTIH
jgi:hypothetical protein